MLLNVSTRVHVESGSSVMIGGFIITGDVAKKVAMRAIGPSLADAGVSSVLADPVLELYDSTGSLIAQNDNCSSLPPDSIPAEDRHGHESFIAVTLPPGSYTESCASKWRFRIGLFELYDSILPARVLQYLHPRRRRNRQRRNDRRLYHRRCRTDESAVRAIVPRRRREYSMRCPIHS
jgi:hypothetical protein